MRVFSCLRPACLAVLLAELPAVSAPANAAGISFSVLHSFQEAEANPAGALISDGLGNFYGTTAEGGSSALGTVFTIRRDGTGFKRLHSFEGGASDGTSPFAALTLDGNGNLYGMTDRGGSSGQGTVFTLRTDGTGFRLLHAFAGGANDGLEPEASLVLDDSGNLYGTTMAGGPPTCCNPFGGLNAGFGTVFTIRVDGTGFRLLHTFSGAPSDGNSPDAPLILDRFGSLFGTTGTGGAANHGTVFAMKLDGGGYQVLHSFAGGASDGSVPYAALTLDGMGGLFGTTIAGGAADDGTVFKLGTDGSGFALLHSFAGGASDGRWPHASLILDDSGSLYGTTLNGGHTSVQTAYGETNDGSGTVFRIGKDGAGFRLLRAFPADADDSATPWGSLILDRSGNLYGTTYSGGAPNAGTIFRVSTDGSSFEVVYSFGGFQDDGGFPMAPLIPGGSGYLYGTTVTGGSGGGGIVFRIRSDGAGFQILHAFGGGANDGNNPSGALAPDQAGNLYGSTAQGGATSKGTVFTLKTDGTGFQLLHSFAGGAADGSGGFFSLVLDGTGTLYGTTDQGGPDNAGTIFRIKTDGTGFQLLHAFSFSSASNGGANPWGPLTLDGQGNLYGTAVNGGGPSSGGTVFTIKTDGSGFNVLRIFGEESVFPSGSLVIDRSGNLYGTTMSGGGPSIHGTLFKLRTDGTGFALLHTFNGTDGTVPNGSLVMDAFGDLYGTTNWGGRLGAGTVFMVKTDGTGFRVLHAFGEDESGGLNPFASIFLDASGAIFGTTQYGGAGSFGTVFTLFRPVAVPGPLVPVRKR